jgi:hypothetical protein
MNIFDPISKKWIKRILHHGYNFQNQSIMRIVYSDYPVSFSKSKIQEMLLYLATKKMINSPRMIVLE